MPVATTHLVAVTPGGDITEDQLAGYYMWFTIPEAMLSLSKVRKSWKEAGLDVERLPKARRAEHVAQEAIRQVQRVVSNGHREEIRVEQVDRNRNYLIYQVTRHVQDKENRVIEHPKALRVIFVFDDESLEFEPLDGASHDEVQHLIDEIQANYDANSTKMPGRKLRTHLRHYIEAAGAEAMRDSVYFMAKHNKIRPSSKLYAHHGASIDGGELLESFAQMLQLVYGRHGGSDFHVLPCINDEGQRAYLARKFQENLVEDMKAFRDECMELVADKDKRTRGFRADLRDRLIDQAQAFEERREKFTDLLGTTMTDLDRDMSLAKKALSKFITEAGF